MTLGYTPPSREAIYAALFALVSVAQIGSSPAFKTIGRRIRSQAQLSAEEKPALYQLIARDGFKAADYGIPYANRLGVELYIFVQQEDDTQLVSPLLTPLVDAVIAALQPSDTDEVQTLGGLVYNVKILDVDYREGLMESQAFAVMTIQILVGGLQPS